MKKYSFNVNNEDYNVEIVSIENGNAKVNVNGEVFNIRINSDKGTTTSKATSQHVETTPIETVYEPETEKIQKIEGTVTGHIKSPLPGIVRGINVKVGDMVKLGDSVLVLDAMKMDNDIHADAEGKVLSISVNSGDSVMEGDILIELGA